MKLLLRILRRKLTIMLLCVLTALGILTFEFFLLKTIKGDFRPLIRYYMPNELTQFLEQTSSLNERLLLIDKNFLAAYHDLKSRGNLKNFIIAKHADFYDVVTFALLWPADRNEQKKMVLPILRMWDTGFWVETISYTAYTKFHPYQKDIPLGFILQKKKGVVVIEVILLHERQGDFWWHGSLEQDKHYLTKLKNLKISEKVMSNLVLKEQGAFDKFIFETDVVEGRSLSVPKDIPHFVSESSHFIECNYDLADKFFTANGRDSTARAMKEVHKMAKLLARVKAVLDGRGIPFWLSSGTLLGYYRQCDMIPYAKDVDIQIFKKDYSEGMIEAMQVAQFKLAHILGRVNDSLEVSFFYNDLKLDIFFIYDDGTHFYNAAHRIAVVEGKVVLPAFTYKYTFPKFTLCWTEFLEMKVRVPCETDSVILANYGPNWHKPVAVWNFYRSPFNVELMYTWTQEEASLLARLF